jgi:hypothetical protein
MTYVPALDIEREIESLIQLYQLLVYQQTHLATDQA